MEKEIEKAYLTDFEKYKDEVIKKINDYASICTKDYLIMLYGYNRAISKEFHYHIKTEVGYIVIDGIKIKALEYRYKRFTCAKIKP